MSEPLPPTVPDPDLNPTQTTGPAAGSAGQMIGGYRLLQKVGEGGTATRSLLGRCLVDEGRFAEAELLLDAYATLSREFGAAHTRTKTVAERIVELYDASTRPAQSAEWRGKL